MGNVQQLQEAGIISDPSELSEEDTSALESLTAEEISCLIAIKAKLGDAFIDRHASPSTQFAF